MTNIVSYNAAYANRTENTRLLGQAAENLGRAILDQYGSGENTTAELTTYTETRAAETNDEGDRAAWMPGGHAYRNELGRMVTDLARGLSETLPGELSVYEAPEYDSRLPEVFQAWGHAFLGASLCWKHDL